MSKDYERFNKFNETYDMYGDGIEEEVIKFLKGRFPDAYKKALKEAEDDPFIKESGNPAEGAIIPSMIWGYVEDDDEFYSAVENWFKENYPGDELK